MRNLIFISILLTLNSAYSQLNFKTLRYEEDYRFLNADTSKEWYKRTKFCALSKDKDNFISFGGDIRYQYFHIKNDNWGDGLTDNDGYIFSRLLLHGDLHLGKFRFFSQLQSSMANGKVSTNPVDEDPLDLHQAFFETDLNTGKKEKLIFRIGRQEFAYGSQRLVAVRDGSNSRQSFDAAKIRFVTTNYSADLFYSHYVRPKKGIFDDTFNKDLQFWGAYLTCNKIAILQNFDLYYLGLWKRTAHFNDGAGKELRHSIGARVFCNPQKFRYDIEMGYQFGKFAGKDIRAWTLSFNTGYQFKGAKLKPEIGLKTELISGDKKYGDNKLETFNPLFPRGGYFGLASLVGPSNLFDIHPSISLKLAKSIQLNLDSDIFWRLSTKDGIYGPNVALIYPGHNNPYSKLGDQMAVDLNYTPNPYLYFRLEFTWFDAKDFLKAAGTGKDIFFTGITAQLKF